MSQLTLRGIDEELERRLRRIATEKAVSLNEAALYLMRRGAGLESDGSPAAIGHSLDHLMGLWSEEEAAEFAAATRDFEQIDEEEEFKTTTTLPSS